MAAPHHAVEEIISDADAQRDIALLLRRVREGRSYVVTAQGSPVARLTPCEGADEERVRRAAAKEALFRRLDSQPAMNLGFAWTRDELYER
jgi:prevent-host-death family protein